MMVPECTLQKEPLMLASHDRFAYSPITERPDFTWPDGRRLAIHLSLNLEQFA